LVLHPVILMRDVMHTNTTRTGLSLLAVCIAGCSGTIGETQSRGGNRSGLAGVNGSSVGGGGVVVSGDACKTLDPGPSYIRRLNRFEYDNTVHDLLGDTTAPASAFPAEEMSLGFDNNAQALEVSPALTEQFMLAAEKLATTAVGNLSQLTGCDSSQMGSDACAQKFVDTFVPKAFRRPLDADERTRFLGILKAGQATDFATGVRWVVETVLISAPFLYRVELGAPPTAGEKVVKLDPYEMASRLSYLLWASMPDAALMDAAKAGKLQDAADIATQATRMLHDPKAKVAIGHFNEQWLHLDAIDGVEKDTTVFPDFTDDMPTMLSESTHRFVEDVFWNDGKFASLFTSSAVFVNDKLASYYGLPSVTGTDYTRVKMDHAAGILSQPGMMSMLGKANQTAPVQRGKFVREQLLCNTLPPPPANIQIKPPDLSPTLSTRERFTEHRTEALCAGCHTMMDPIGLGLENFDGAGKYRTTENGAPIDVSGEVTSSDITGTFNGATDLANKLASSDQVKKCVSTSWFHFAYGRADIAADQCSLAVLEKSFADSGYTFEGLVTALVRTDAFLYRRAIPAGGAQ
jgi:hypothetical protein